MKFAARLIPFILTFLAAIRAAGQTSPQVEASIGSSMVVVGEETFLTLVTQGVNVIDWPDLPPNIAPLALTRDDKFPLQVNGYIREAFRYRVSAFQPGTYRIPPFEFRTATGPVRTEPVMLRVFPVDSLVTNGIKIRGAVTPYLTGVFLQKDRPFLGERIDTEAKLYLSTAPPNRLSLADGKVIQFEKDGLAAWRFTTDRQPTGELDYEGQRFRVYTYQSSLSALREGRLELGPGSADAFFFHRASPLARTIQFPAAILEVRPLPEGAPEGFEGAVGTFSMDVRPLGRDLEFGDALTVEIGITGTGNLNRFPGPKLIDPKGRWKQFEMIAKPSGTERRSRTGTAEFSQSIRPLETVEFIPPYRFVFFDPLVEKYRTLSMPKIPITVTGAPGFNRNATGSLAFLEPGNMPLKTFNDREPVALWWWQIVPAVLALGLVILEVRRRLEVRNLNAAPSRELDTAILEVESQSDDQVAFYREASKVATKWRGGKKFESIHEKRDEICFRPDAEKKPVEENEKRDVLKLLRTLAPVCLIGLVLLFQTAPLYALPDDPGEAKGEILKLMQSDPAAEHFYNMALCEKALGENGSAVLWAYRFQLHGGDAESLLEEFPGARAKEQKWLVSLILFFPRPIYLQILFLGGWSLGLLVMVAFFLRTRWRKGLLITLPVIAVLALPIGSAGWFWYPDEISFEPIEDLSVITGQKPLRLEPHEGAKIMRETPVGSLCKIEAARSGWTRVILPGGQRGWIRSDEVTPIKPKEGVIPPS